MAKNKPHQRWAANRKKKALGALKELIKRIENDELSLQDYGWWASNLGNTLTFRIIVLAHDDKQEMQRFQKFE